MAVSDFSQDKGQEPGGLAALFAAARPPREGFSAWFLGQNSFLLKGADGFSIAVDPYLSDWCATRGESAEPTARSRAFPPPLSPAELDVDLVLLTHSHCDHADPLTLAAVAARPRTMVAGPRDALAVARDAGVPESRLRLLHAGETADFGAFPGGGVRATGTFALPTDGSDLNHLGFLVGFPGGATFWDTGDSAWCELLPELAAGAFGGALPAGAAGPDVMAVCINSGYGNLSHWEAAKLAGAAGARWAVPAHWDLFPHNRADPEAFRNSLEKKAPGAACARMAVGERWDLRGEGSGRVFAPA